MKLTKLFLLTLITLIFTSKVFAGAVSTDHFNIEKLYFYSNSHPSFEGMIQLRKEPLPWKTNTTCNNVDLLIRKEDSHLYSAALAAYSSDLQIRVFADEAQNNAGKCFVNAIEIKQ